MSDNFRFEQEDFHRKMRTLAGLSERELSLFLDSRMLAIGKEARAQTPIADRAKIGTDLGAELKSERVDKKGRIRRRYSYKPVPRAYGIVNARQRKAGKPALTGSAMAEAAKKLIVGRLRAVGSLRSGWTRALGMLGQAIGEAIDSSGPKVKQQSSATPARPGWSPEVKMEYRLTVRPSGGHEQIDPRVEAALQSGFDKESIEMDKHLGDKLRDMAKRAGAL